MTEPPPRVQRCLPAMTATTAGLFGVVLQLVWMRFAVQWYGTSATTIAAVLATTLVGLAIGALLVGAFVRRFGIQADTRRFVASCQLIVVGLLGGTAIWLSQHIALFDLRMMVPSMASVSLVVTTAIALLLPNIVLGSILPLLVGSPDTGTSVGKLYAAETIGGAVGALLTGLVLIHRVGLIATLLAASVGSAMIGVVGVLFIAHQRQSSQAHRSLPSTPQLEPTVVAAASLGSGFATRLMLAVLLAGVASVGLEVVWQRLLILIVGTDTYSYTIVLTSYLIGIAVGSRLGTARWLASSSQSPFSWLQLCVAVSSLALLWALTTLASGPGQRWLASVEDFATAGRFVFCIGFLLVPAAFTGACLPVAVQLLSQTGCTQAAATGRVYGVGAIGNVLGVMLVGFCLIPAAGLQLTAIVLTSVAVVAGWVAIASSRRVAPAVAGLTVVIAGSILMLNRAPVGLPPLQPNQELLFYREGPANTVAVISTRETDLPAIREMTVDGVVIGASTGSGVNEKQQLLAALPFFVRSAMADSRPISTVGDGRQPQLLTIGLGTGILANQLLENSNDGVLTCVELSPAVIEASEQFTDDNQSLNRNEQASIVQGDGIHFLRQSNEQFDVIVSDGKSRPGHAGNVAFFATDYYDLVASRLTSNGCFIQWVSLDADVRETQTIIQSFASRFPVTAIGIAPPDSIYLIGSQQPIVWETETITRQLQQFSESLGLYDWRTVDDFRSLLWLCAADIAAALPATAELNTFERPVLEQFAIPLAADAIGKNKRDNLMWLKTCVLDSQIMAIEDGQRPDERRSFTRSATAALLDAGLERLAIEHGWLNRAAVHIEAATKVLPNLSRGHWLTDAYLDLAEQHNLQDQPESVIAALRNAAKFSPRDALAQAVVGQRLRLAVGSSAAVSYFYRATKLDPNSADYLVGFAGCLIDMQKARAAIKPLRQAIQLQPERTDAHQLMITAAETIGDRSLAAESGRVLNRLLNNKNDRTPRSP